LVRTLQSALLIGQVKILYVNHRDRYLEQQQTEKIETEVRYVYRIRITKVYACCPLKEIYTVASKFCPIRTSLLPPNVQGGSDISGTLSKLHRRIKKSTFLLIISCLTVSALCRSGNKNKQTHSGKNKSTRSYETYHSLQASRRGRTMRKIMNYEDIKKGTVLEIIKESSANFLFLEDLLIL
jgi:hypothetical protein